MRVKAQVTVNNRMLSNQGGNCKPKGKSPVSSLAIGRKAKHLIKDSEKDPEVFVLHCTAQNRAGFKYAVRRGNVEKVFTRFVDEGKAGFIFERFFGGFFKQLLYASTMPQAIPDICCYSRIFRVSEGISPLLKLFVFS